ncbi:MAG: DUF192 domain-containing protein [Chloroflexota bacterium]
MRLFGLFTPVCAAWVVLAGCGRVGAASTSPRSTSTAPASLGASAATPAVSLALAASSTPPPSGARSAAATSPAVARSPSATPTFSRGTVIIRSVSGRLTMPVEVADNEVKREYGLMNRRSLAADAGMIFVFHPPADPNRVGFWMKDTLIPLSIAFVSPNLTIESIQEMAPLSLDVHRPAGVYLYAIEANTGFFASHRVTVGDRMTFSRA